VSLASLAGGRWWRRRSPMRGGRRSGVSRGCRAAVMPGGPSWRNGCWPAREVRRGRAARDHAAAPRKTSQEL